MPLSLRRFVLVSTAIAAAACATTAPPSGPIQPSSATGPHVLVLSDLHFNPFGDPTLVDALQRADAMQWRSILERSTQKAYSPYGADTNYPLLASAIAAMHRAAPNPELVLIAGDFLAHGFQSAFKKALPNASDAELEAFAAKTVQFLARELGAAFPRAQILPALGNNDSVCGDYKSEPGSPFLRAFAEAWRPLVTRRGSAPDFIAEFAQAGHYTAFSPTLRARVVVINNVYFSPAYANTCGTSQADPGRDTWRWLNGVLTSSRSRGEAVVLLSHIPIGIDVFATLHGGSVATMLEPQDAADLVTLLQQFAGTVRYALYGHTHMTEFRLVPAGAAAPLATHGIPAVSPLFGNNPAFAVFLLDPATRGIADYTMHALSNGAWSPEYSFRQAYGGDGPSAQRLVALAAALAAEGPARTSFMRFYDSGSGRAGPSAADWRPYWCGIGNVDVASFDRCFGGTKATSLTP